MKRTPLFFWILLSIFFSFERPAFPDDSLPPFEVSEVCRRYTRGTATSELVKLLCLVGRLWNTDFKIIYGGNTYDANTAIKYGRSYLLKHYKNEAASRWIKLHVYRAGDQMIYLKYPSGKRRPVGEVLLEELRNLNQMVPSKV